MKERLHAAHTCMGYDSMVRRARKCIFWLGMDQDLKQLARSCDICYQFKPNNQKEPLMQHSEGQLKA